MIVGAVTGVIIQTDPLAGPTTACSRLHRSRVPIASLATGVGLGFVLGLVHLTSI